MRDVSKTKVNKRKPANRLSADKPNAVKRPGVCPIVAIGASAGGLETFKNFFDAMPPDSGLTFVLIQHLDPDHASMTAQLLARHSLMTVVELEDQTRLQANHVYVNPPNKELSLNGGVISLLDQPERHGVRLPIDFFLRSLAEDQRENAIAIIMSGSGTDGTLGIKAIKDWGGVVIAQSPDEAQFSSMPSSVIGTGLVDFILRVKDMPQALIQYVHNASELSLPLDEHVGESDRFEQLLEAVRLHTKYDFRDYKKGTVVRRIERRMSLGHITDIDEYVRLVQNNKNEAVLLFKDLLISVTNFFRDPQAFKELEQHVIERLVSAKDGDEPIRVWIPGCATGEEAYSVSMMFHEQIRIQQKRCPVQIFASDIDEQALAVARAGAYPINIAADIPPEYLRQYFIKRDQTYRVGKQLRNSIVFAAQNIVSDPPFSKLDLICCRNLLIYLDAKLQRKIISMFHFVLNDGGFLFLGSSETIGQHGDLFQPICKKSRLYRRSGPARGEKLDLPYVNNMERFGGLNYSVQARSAEPANLGKITQQILMQRYAPFSVLINSRHEILYVSGQSGPYLELTTGEPTQNLMTITREGLRSKLRNMVQNAYLQKMEIKGKGRVKRDQTYHPVIMTVIPVTTPKAAEGLVVVTFEDGGETLGNDSERGLEMDVTQEALISALESELNDVKEDLRSNIEDLESSNEELKASNEEVLSMNEELQSTNEELETSKEELQSLNEELTTVNSQLQDKVEELALTNDDMTNLLANTDIAALFLDRQFRIKRFTPAICKLFNLIFSDIGRPINDISYNIKGLTLLSDAEMALMNLSSLEKEVVSESGEHFIQRVKPFCTDENKIDGVVVTFINVTRLKQTQESLMKSKERIELLLHSTGEAIYGVDNEGRCIFVNSKCLQLLGFGAEELMGKNVHDLIHHTHEDRQPHKWQDSFVYRCLNSGVGDRGGHEVAWRKDGTWFPTLISVEPILERGNVTGAMVIFRDITEEKAVSSKLDHLAKHDSLTGLVNRREFEARLARVLNDVKQDSSEHILCYLDLDQFKVINDTCGHLAGDEMLRQITGVLEGQIRKRDTLARLGGDEFGLLMEHCDVNEGIRVANCMRDAVANYRFLWEEKTHTVGVSIGVVALTESVGSATNALKAADVACYAAKEGGRNKIRVYHQQDSDELATQQGEMRWVAQINQALAENRLFLSLQPIMPIDHNSDQNLSYEVLLRMETPDGDMILPDDFLRAAERYNLSTKLDRWVIKKVFSWMTQNESKLERITMIAVNLSGSSLADDEFLKFAVAELLESQVPPKKICFEITETAAITNLASANRFMHAFKQFGCEFALDDFGTGLSSFAYLRTLPVEYLKISGLFVKDIVNNTIDFAMVKSINEIGQVMGKKTIAESVENSATLEKLKTLGVNYAQGYLVGRPAKLEDMEFDQERGRK